MKIEVLEQEIVDKFVSRVEKIALPKDLKFAFQGVEKLNTLIKISKIPDHYVFETGKDILVQINPEYYIAVETSDENSTTSENSIIDILFDQEIDKIKYDFEKDKLKISKPTFSSNKGIIDKYSFEEVSRAIECIDLLKSQKSDQKSEII
jgi:hypothetical protein